eukprot:TRINITY_DN2674_c0_g1_i4.p1 TRINITY_DN2674_c0_g1~~TRINITY_DN2674_c0_g1_i4.p1  ORF type:complete len:457 (-),score=76.24 TRINITY_DN2674_c0_g1_i4:20-1390(-)
MAHNDFPVFALNIIDVMKAFRTAEKLSEILYLHSRIKECLTGESDVYEGLKKDTYYSCFWLKSMFDKLNKKMESDTYQRNRIDGKHVLIIGGGPAGLTAAIECTMLGAKCTVVEKRKVIGRNNILHLYPWTMSYLNAISAKTFYRHFGTGGINHIGTRQIQRVLLKIALILGVNVFYGTEFEGSVEPFNQDSWKVDDLPGTYHFLIGADGVRSKVAQVFSFEKKQFTGSKTIGITVNYENNHTKQEVTLPEFGISKIFKRQFFQPLDEMNINLENLVYYRGETHYMVMTAKKSSLIERGVLIDPSLDSYTNENTHEKNLQKYLREVADHVGIPSTSDLIRIHTGAYDHQIFDFSSREASEEPMKYYTVGDSVLPVFLIGDALIEPFWPLGTGCNRAILSALDATWIIANITHSRDIDIQSETERLYSIMKTSLSESISPQNSTCINPSLRYNSQKI